MIWLVMFESILSAMAASTAIAAVDPSVPFDVRLLPSRAGRDAASAPREGARETAARETTKDTLDIEVVAPEGYAFNTKAPMVLEVSQLSRHFTPSDASTKRLRFHLPGSQRRDFKVSLYVCEDATAVCHKRSAWARWSAERESALIVRY